MRPNPLQAHQRVFTRKPGSPRPKIHDRRKPVLPIRIPVNATSQLVESGRFDTAFWYELHSASKSSAENQGADARDPGIGVCFSPVTDETTHLPSCADVFSDPA